MGLIQDLLGLPQKQEVKAVYHGDLKEYLENLGIREEIESGNTSCSVCGRDVDATELGVVYPTSDGLIMVTCNRPNCVSTVKTPLIGE